MRCILAALTFAAVLYGNVSAEAEKRIFVIANNADGYGVDRCLASGATCGRAVATAYCKAKDFAQAGSFRQVDREEITGRNSGGQFGLSRRSLRGIRRHRVHPLTAGTPPSPPLSTTVAPRRVFGHGRVFRVAAAKEARPLVRGAAR